MPRNYIRDFDPRADRPNLVDKLQVSILAKWLERYPFSVPPQHCDEEAARMISQPIGRRNVEMVRDTLDIAWACYRMMKEVCKMDMDELERKALSATWWR